MEANQVRNEIRGRSNTVPAVTEPSGPQSRQRRYPRAVVQVWALFSQCEHWTSHIDQHLTPDTQLSPDSSPTCQRFHIGVEC